MEINMLEKIISLDSVNFDKAIAEKRPILIDFWAKWCGPCKILSPILKEVASEINGISVAKVNVDECEDIAMRFYIKTIPTLMIFKNGEIKAKTLGFKNKNQILAFIEENK